MYAAADDDSIFSDAGTKKRWLQFGYNLKRERNLPLAAPAHRAFAILVQAAKWNGNFLNNR